MELVVLEGARPKGSKAWKWAALEAALEAASSSIRGSGWAPSGPASCWECRAAQSRQARPAKAQEPSWGAAKGALRPCCWACRGGSGTVWAPGGEGSCARGWRRGGHLVGVRVRVRVGVKGEW